MKLDYIRIYLKEGYFTELEHLLFRIIVLEKYPDDMYFSSRVRKVITNLINDIRSKLNPKGYLSVEELEEIIRTVILAEEQKE
ncbi:hypothetical protein EA456_00435 [Streptococcus dysgalactiae subsp. dysgalactiae]|uniref:hypothetical protein n=1 Tax=Streptococcus dysgalactiae TaxID=1334 RepID=UPI0001AABA8F|nr:hypothetical protein [Streptococcus dysgalactiae]ADX25560.1 phage protein [Streptococcus dysgalactiae subsp. equisimilis ATCC 12394]OCX05173.1 hypothetical protein BBG09_02665 [Streptococcus dysgalactiae subsp. equisimilis]QET82761.1 hypothetical protein FOB62_05555 [Streptococcus dysgalactiae]QGG99105.1 hypothetical protein EA456_00435 [Streptococcus dysgalactiae subsp. dysgalactiae]SQB67498.1 phage protein [Streptococcus dysgalactiae]